jgi:hemolysin III
MSSHEEEVHPTSGYTRVEEWMNSITHGIGIPLAIAGLVLSVVYASIYKGASMVTACSIYGSSLILLYSASTLYHSARNLSWKRFFLICDHTCIYFLIAGSYTPFTLGPLRGALGWTIFGLTWGFAFLGLMKEILFPGRGGFWSTMIYLAMGWLCLMAVKPLYENMTMLGFTWLMLGGVCYSLGTIFYLWRGMKYHHAIWHLFVLAGSTFQFFSVLAYLIPNK